MQDAVPAEGVSVGPGLYNQEALFANPFKDGREEALVIDVRGQITYLRRAASDTGWAQDPVAGVSGTFTEVVAAVHPNGDVWAFCVPDQSDGQGAVLPLRLVQLDGAAECGWLPQADAIEWPVAGLRSLCVSYSPDGGPTIAGCSPATGKLTLATIIPNIAWTSGSWPAVWGHNGAPWTRDGVVTVSAQGRVVGGGFLSYAKDPDGLDDQTTNTAYVYYVINGQVLTRYTAYTGHPTTIALTPVVCGRTVSQFCGTWNVPNYTQWFPNGDVGFMYLDADGDLVTGHCPPMWAAEHSGAPFTWRTQGLEFDSATCWHDADGKVHVFGTKHDGTLHVLHQGTWNRAAGLSWPPRMLFLWTQAVAKNARPREAEVTAVWRSGQTHLDLFATDPTGTVWSTFRESDTRQWQPWFAVSPSAKMAPGAPVTAVWRSGETHLDLFATGPDGTVQNAYWDMGSGWQPWLPVSPSTKMQPGARVTAVWRAGSRLDLFATDPTGTVWSTSWDIIGRQWQPWTVVAPSTKVTKMAPGAPVTAVWRSDYLHLDLFVTGPDGTVHSTYWDVGTRQWQPWFAVSPSAKMAPGAPVTAVWRSGETHLDLFATGPDGTVQSTYWEMANVQWQPWFAVSPSAKMAPGASVTAVWRSGDTHMDLFSSGPDGTVQSTYWEKQSGQWRPWFAVSPETRVQPGAAVTALWRSSETHLDLFAAGPDGTVWDTWWDRQDPHWQPWQLIANTASYYPNVGTVVTVGVQADVTSFQLDPYPDYKPSELIKLSDKTAAEAYCVSTQDVTTSDWHIDKVRLPQTKPAAPFVVSHYVADVTLLSLRDTPMPDHNVTVSADSLVEVQIGAVSYQVGPGRAVTATTNGAGKVVISVAARGLNPAILRLNADGLESGIAVNFASEANDFLAGHGTLPSQRGTFTPELLRGAVTTPNRPGLAATQLADWEKLEARGLTPQVVVDHCANLYAQASGNGPLRSAMLAGASEPQPIVGYVIQLWDEERPAYQAFRTQEELDAYKRDRDLHASYGGWWNDFTIWASDVWEGIKSGAVRVAEVIVSTVTEIAVWVGEAVVSIGEFVISAVEQAVQAVEAVFQMIADAVTRVIDWLKSLFNLTDIWDTKLALQTLASHVLTLTSETCTHFGMVTHGWFAGRKTQSGRRSPPSRRNTPIPSSVISSNGPQRLPMPRATR